MVRSSTLALLLCGGLLLTSGCAPAPGTRLIGKWEADLSAMQSAMNVPPQSAEKFAETMKNAKMTVEFKADGVSTTSMSMPNILTGGTTEKTIDAQWTVVSANGDDLTLTVTPKSDDDEAKSREVAIHFVNDNRIEMPAGLPGAQQQKIVLNRVGG